MNEPEKSRIEQFKSAPVGMTGRAFLQSARPAIRNLQRRKSRRLGS